MRAVRHALRYGVGNLGPVDPRRMIPRIAGGHVSDAQQSNLMGMFKF